MPRLEIPVLVLPETEMVTLAVSPGLPLAELTEK
jgi:hypothetical protein